MQIWSKPRMLRYIVLGFVGAILICAPAQASGQTLSLAELVKHVKVALLLVEQSAVKDKLPSIETATLNVHAIQILEAGGKLKFYVISAGANTKAATTSNIKLVLGPPSANSATDVASDNLAESIANSIVSAAEAIAEARIGQPPLEPRSLTAEITFAVTTEGEGGVSIQFPPFSAEAKGGISSSNTHSIIISYKWPHE